MYVNRLAHSTQTSQSPEPPSSHLSSFSVTLAPLGTPWIDVFLGGWLLSLSITASSPCSPKHMQEASNGRVTHMHTCPISLFVDFSGLWGQCSEHTCTGPSGGMATPWGNCIFIFFVELPNFSTVAAQLKEPTGVFISAPHLFSVFKTTILRNVSSGQLIAETPHPTPPRCPGHCFGCHHTELAFVPA